MRNRKNVPERHHSYQDTSSKMEDELLREKVDFQLHWEETHSTHQDTHSVWNLAENIGTQNIGSFYDIDHRSSIGTGHYGVVRKCRLKTEPSKIYAVKSIEKSKLKGNFNLLRNEFEILRSCDHPNINQFYELFQDDRYFHFVLEYCEGGDITSRVEKFGPMDEATSQVIILQTLKAISHLHSCGVIHRDIKPDNFLFKNKNSAWPIKLIDFGLSKRVPISGKLTTFLGTPYYVAPEVLQRKPYDFKSDTWSVGVMLYLMLAAKFPFQGSNNQETFNKIMHDDYNMSVSHSLRQLSKAGKSFMARLLAKNPDDRYTVVQALRDPWFDDLNIKLNFKGKNDLTRDVLMNLRSFKSESTMVKEVIRLLVMIHDDMPEVKNLTEAFFYLDALNLGVINFEELKKAYDEAGVTIEDTEIHTIIQCLEIRMTKVLTFTEFVSACIDRSFYCNENYLSKAFNRFDVGHDGFITYSDLSECFSRFGIDLPRSEIMKIIAEADSNKDGRISFEEFIAIMNKDTHKMTVFPEMKHSKFMIEEHKKYSDSHCNLSTRDK